MQPNPSRRHTLTLLLAALLAFAVVLVGGTIWIGRNFFASPASEVIVQVPTTQPAIPINASDRWTFTGDVLDAVTHQPVKEFYAKIGLIRVAAAPSTQPAVFRGYQDNHPDAFGSGRYKVATAANLPANSVVYVRVEAHGYLPAISPVQSGSATLDFQMQPAADLAGHVFAPDGTPAAGVEVGVVTDGNFLSVKDGKLVMRNQAANDKVISGADGSYDLLPQSGKFAVAAAGEAGFAQADEDALNKSTDLHLSAWARIEGTLRIGDQTLKTAGNSGVGARPLAEVSNPNTPMIVFEQSVKTDAAGHFVMEKLPPGQWQVYHWIFQLFGRSDQQMGVTTFTQTTVASLAPGESKQLNLGGGGRRVVGRVVLPPSITSGRYYMATHIVNSRGGDSQPTYCMEFAADGAFGIEDVQAGDYHASVEVETMIGGVRQRAATLEADFSVPEVTAELRGKPLEIGDIKMTGN